MTSSGGEEREGPGPVIRDNRRIDPKTGEVRGGGTSAAGSAATEAAKAEPAEDAGPATPGDEETVKLKEQLDERTSDLQRLQAEYSNYRKRVDRDRTAVREEALGGVLGQLLPILDDLDRAREHGELTGGFKSVGDALDTAVGKLGLERFGAEGEPFDPTVHEALMHSYSADVTEPTCVGVLQPGYRIGSRILRPARVAVAEPSQDDEPGSSGDDE